MSFGEWTPLYFSLILLFITGGIVGVIVNDFPNSRSPTGLDPVYVENTISLLANGLCFPNEWYLIGGVCANPFFFLPDRILEFIGESLAVFTSISLYISIPLIILILLGLILGLLRMWEAITPG